MSTSGLLGSTDDGIEEQRVRDEVAMARDYNDRKSGQAVGVEGGNGAGDLTLAASPAGRVRSRRLVAAAPSVVVVLTVISAAFLLWPDGPGQPLVDQVVGNQREDPGDDGVREYDPEAVQRGSALEADYVERAVDAAARTEAVRSLAEHGYELSVEWVMLIPRDERAVTDEADEEAYFAQLEFAVHPAATPTEAMRNPCPAITQSGMVSALLLHGTVVVSADADRDSAWVFVVYSDEWRASCGPDGELLPPEEETDVREPVEPEPEEQ